MKRSWFWLAINLLIGLYFILMQFSAVNALVIVEALHELLGISLLITLVISTIISYRDFRLIGFKDGIFSFFGFLTGLVIIVSLTILTIYPID